MSFLILRHKLNLRCFDLMRLVPSIFLTLSLAACSSSPFSSATFETNDFWQTVVDRFAKNHAKNHIKKSPSDTRRYQYLTLNNQLKVLLISDASAEKAAASLDVHVGSRYDPPHRQGLAHFLEHMLFLGTQKYPNADGYQKFISENGGSHNAYTSFEHTNYYFNIDNASFAPALDRFANFFTAPLFDENYVQREVNAVEAEYRARIKDENRRILDATRQLINPAHPYHQFTVGGLNTLSSPTVRDDMLDFYQRYYSASRMTLVVIGDYSLQALQHMVTQRFSAVSNNDSKTEAINQPLFNTDKYSLPLILAVQSEKPIRQLRLTFPMSDLTHSYRTKPSSFIGNILGHEGEGSLLSILKANGLAEGLATGIGLNYTGGSTFQINIALTAKGVEQLKPITDEVFFAINAIRQVHKQQPNVTRTLFVEQRQLAAMNFRFYQPPAEISAAMGAAANLHFYPPAAVIWGDYDYSEYRPTRIANSLARMVPQNMLLTLVAQHLPSDFESQQLSPWFSAPYSVNPVSQSWLNDWQGDLEHTLASESFHLPVANNFIAKDFSLFSAALKTDIPMLAVDQQGMRLWVKTDDTFEVPKADAMFSFLTASSRQSSRHAVMSELYARVVNEQLNEYLYPAYLAGMHFTFYSHMRGFTLGLGGYNDGLVDLAQTVLPALSTVNIASERFNNIKAELARGWQLSMEGTPYRRLATTMQQALYANNWTEAELIEALDDVTMVDLQHYIHTLWPSVYIEGLLHGNVNNDTVEALRYGLAALPNCACDLSSKQGHVGVVDLPLGRQQQVQRLSHSDAAVLWYFQAPDDSLQSVAMTNLAASILHPNLFDELRTEQQLGYVVGARAFNRVKLPGILFQVQSPSSSEQEILLALKQFMAGFLEQGVDVEVFNRHWQALALRLRESDHNLTDRSGRFWGSLALADESFNRRERLAVIVDKMTYEHWFSFVRKLLLTQEASLIQLTETAAEAVANTSDGSSSALNKQKTIYYR